MTTALLHPSLGELKTYAEGASEDRSLATHLARCGACRSKVAGLRALREELSQLPTPEPATDLLRRILAARAARYRPLPGFHT